MRVQLFRFAGYPAGATDFATVGAVIPANPLSAFDEVLETIGKAVAGTVNARIAITVVGNSDRQDRADFNCDQRRQSEIDAAQARALSAWDWTKGVITDYATNNGWAGADWWDTSPNVTWDVIVAAAGMLLNGSANEAERAQNRRVDFLISVFMI